MAEKGPHSHTLPVFCDAANSGPVSVSSTPAAKSELCERPATDAAKRPFKTRLIALAICATTILLLWEGAARPSTRCSWSKAQPTQTIDEAWCQQQDPWQPSPGHPVLPDGDANDLARLLSGAVQVDTSVPDEWGALTNDSSKEVKENYRAAFEPFEDYLSRSFPLVHSKLKKEIVNEHGLVFTWQGGDEALRPLVLMAHQDVVPVEPSTVQDWSWPPFSGHIDVERGLVWGRGATDDKACLITILASLESLLSTDFVPRRTIVASFGFNEESTGASARELADFLVGRYGDNGAALIVDEGMEIIGKDADPSDGGLGVTWAGPGVSEKGYLDVRVVVSTPGGHSSVPPKHTGIGFLSRLVAAIEDHAPQASLDSLDHPALLPFLCLRDAPEIRQRKELHRVLQHMAKLPRRHASGLSARHKVKAASLFKRFLAALSPEEIVSFQTTQAVDLISGGVKINALPERSTATINYRIDVNVKVAELQAWLGDVVSKQSQALGLDYAGWKQPNEANLTWSSLHSTTSSSSSSTKGRVHLEIAFDSALEAAPRTPVEGDEAQAWRLFSSVIRGTWTDTPGEPDGIRVVANEMLGNTDTKSYWRLSRNIFRFTPGSIHPGPAAAPGGGSGIHTVDENAQILGLQDAHRFYGNLILAVQDASLE
ncbi:unnamed protein product [Parajaminaea phylloscopi]